MRRTFFSVAVLIMATAAVAQDDITNAFDDLKRTGIVNESRSEMRQAASAEYVARLVAERPAAGFFCFAEDRSHDIRRTDSIPVRWAGRTPESRLRLDAIFQPGEFCTWQIGVYAPYADTDIRSVSLDALRDDRGRKVDGVSFTCFNTSGTDTSGRAFTRTVSVPKGTVQALWMGLQMPAAASGTYTGTVTVCDVRGHRVNVAIRLTAKGQPVADGGDDEGWRKSRLRWLNSAVGNAAQPTAPYTALRESRGLLRWLGGTIRLNRFGLPSAITTRYTQDNQLDASAANEVLASDMRLVIETPYGSEVLKGGRVSFVSKTPAEVQWRSRFASDRFKVAVVGTMGFDGIVNYRMEVTAAKDADVKDIRLEVPYTKYASRYMMGLGRKGGCRPESGMAWKWNVEKHQDKVWMGNVNAGLNLHFMDDNYVRPLVNIYYALGRLDMPQSWGNNGNGGINVVPSDGDVRVVAYSGRRTMKAGETLHYNFDMQITPVKPLDLRHAATERFYHSNSDVSAQYIQEALKNGANLINVHHKKDIYPFINYPYSDESIADLKRFVADAHRDSLGVRVYYTTRELTVKIPELWALRSLGPEIIHDGPGKDARTLIHRNGPNEWLCRNLATHFIPAWYNAFKKGKYAGDMDISVITTPDSRWNNYYLGGLDWMVRNVGIDGIYIDDSALDRKTMQRARRILDADGHRRTVDLHSWNHMNQWAGYANSLHLYTELLPYIDRLWIGEGFKASNTPDFWLVEMSGIPFGLTSETLEAGNRFRGMMFGMLPRLPWSGNPVPLWHLWDEFGMKDAQMHGFWSDRCPVTSDNADVPVTVFTNGHRAMVVVANWTDMPQKARLSIDVQKLGFTPRRFTVPQIENMQWKASPAALGDIELMGRDGRIILLE